MVAIKCKCRECIASAEQAKQCWSTPGNGRVCKLHAFIRAGKRGKKTWAGALKPIRRECLDCMGASRAGVAECPSGQCVLWPFRHGVTPKTARRRGLAVTD